MALINTTDNKKCWLVHREQGTLICCWWNVNAAVTLENSLSVCQRVKHKTVILFIHSIPRCLTKKYENIHLF